MSNTAVLTLAADGTSDTFALGALGGMSQIRYSSTFPGGCAAFSAAFTAPPDLTHRALQTGRTLIVVRGGSLAWQGTLLEPKRPSGRGAPWQISAVGNAADGKNFVALPSGSNAYNLNQIVDAAIARGLQWSRPASLSNPTGTQPSGFGTVDDALSALTNAGLSWTLTRAGALSTLAPPTTASLIAVAASPPGGRTMDGYANVVYGLYVDVANATLVRSKAAGAAEITANGRVERTVDLTSSGVLTSGQVDTILTAYLARYSAIPSWTGGLTLVRGAVSNMGGGPVDPALVFAGARVRVLVTDPDTSMTGAAPEFVVGDCSYDDDSQTVTLTPYQAQPNDLVAALRGSGALNLRKPWQTPGNPDSPSALGIDTAARTTADAAAVDTSVVHDTGNETIAGVKTFSSAPVVPSGAFPESAVASLVSDLASKAADSNTVHNTGTESVGGQKNFTTGITLSGAANNVPTTPGDTGMVIATGKTTGTTSGTGHLVFAHGLGTTPVGAIGIITQAAATTADCTLSAVSSTNLDFYIYDTANGLSINNSSRTICWVAFAS